MKKWSIEDSKRVYGIGTGFNEFHFLDIDSQGRLCLKMKDCMIALIDVLDELQQKSPLQGLDQVPSLTLRIPQLVGEQIKKLHDSFMMAKNKFNYQGLFKAVYPIKVNQQTHAINAVLSNPIMEYGLEAGTKAEFIITLQSLKDKRSNLIMCNGVKDVDYLSLALQKSSEGYNIIISIETLRELETLLGLTDDYSQLKLCLRIKPYIPVSGHWSHSAGRNSKFGLSVGDLERVISLLNEKGLLGIVHGIHSHIGSQITDLNDFRSLAIYLTTFYNELKSRGFYNLRLIDFGGGLPIDYVAEKTPKDGETFMIYAHNLIEGVLSRLDSSYEQPDILIESGRAITAHSAMLILQILEIKDIFPIETSTNSKLTAMYDSWIHKFEKVSSIKEFEELWLDFLDFDNTRIGLTDDINKILHHELLIGNLRIAIRKIISEKFGYDFKRILENPLFNDLIKKADKIAVCNFSVFNSVCDHILVKQYFPIYPIEFLDSKPETICRIVDITCDSDGEISTFITKSDNQNQEFIFTDDGFPILGDKSVQLEGIPITKTEEMNESYFAVTLVGAYQDIIEFDHNLLGDLPDAEIRLTDQNQWNIRWLSVPESLSDLIKKVGYSIEEGLYKESSYAKDTWNRHLTNKKPSTNSDPRSEEK